MGIGWEWDWGWDWGWEWGWGWGLDWGLEWGLKRLIVDFGLIYIKYTTLSQNGLIITIERDLIDLVDNNLGWCYGLISVSFLLKNL